jgi:hypothetical protein
LRAERLARGFRPIPTSTWGFQSATPKNREYIYTGLGDDKQIRGAAFVVPNSAVAGTNLSADTKISVEVITNQPSCSAGLFLPGFHSEGLTEYGVAYTYAHREEAAASNRYEEHVYALTKASPCVAVRYFIHSTNPAVYETGTITEYDRENLMAIFDLMRRTLSVRN